MKGNKNRVIGLWKITDSGWILMKNNHFSLLLVNKKWKVTKTGSIFGYEKVYENKYNMIKKLMLYLKKL